MPDRKQYPLHLWGLLERAAEEWPGKGVIIRDHGPSGQVSTISYEKLSDIAMHNAGVLRGNNLVQVGRVVLLYFEEHDKNIIWTWSVIAAGGIPAILPPFSNDETTARGQLDNLAALFGTIVVLTSRPLQTHFVSCPAFRLHCVEGLQGMVSQAPYTIAPNFDPDCIAVLLFTSGSTGNPKAVEFRHRQLVLSAQAKQQMHGTSSETNFMTWVSFDHSVNFAEMHINAMNTGSNQVHVNALELMKDPARFYDLLSDDRIGYTFSPNSFLWRATKSFKARCKQPKLDLSALRVVIVGGEATHVATLYEANELVATLGAECSPVKAVYGLSETCSACFYNYESSLYDISRKNQFSSVGKHLPACIEMRIVDSTLHPVASEGAIQLRGDVVFKGYYNNPDATEACKTTDGWFDTGDLGRLDENGNLEIVGRTKEILVINGNKYSAFALESAIETKVSHGITRSYTAAFAVWDSQSGSESAVILFNPVDSVAANKAAICDLITSIRQVCLAFCSKAPIDVVPLPQNMMPKSSISKLSRQKLQNHYVRGVFDKYKISGNTSCPGDQIMTALATRIAENIARETGISVTSMTTATPIIHVGLDSMSYIRIKDDLESYMSIKNALPMKVLFESSNVAELEKAIIHNSAPIGSLPQYTPCVALKDTGSKLPLFCIHAGDGEVTHFLPLLHYLPDRPIYAFQAKGRNPGEGKFGSMDELVTCYYHTLRAIQRHGPYAFLGYCWGGVVAFELTKRLEADGHLVVFCGGINSPPNILDVIPYYVNAKEFAVQTLTLLGLIDEEQSQYMHDRLTDAPDNMSKVYELIGSIHRWNSSDWKGLTAARMEGWRKVFLSLLDIAKEYQIRGRVLRYDCFHVSHAANLSVAEWNNKVRQWDQFAGETTYWEVQGRHHSILKEPNVEVFQKSLNDALGRAGIQ
jgi:acyl-CoA synthetase (AMP-forming)/AMP-acid ligase II/thioesterase domain-containing protein/acyl carrier protein